MKKWGVVIVLAIAQFVMVLDSTVMNVSISKIIEDLHTSVSALQSCITFYSLTMAALMLLGAKLCSRYGLMKAFSVGAVIYGIGSLITGFSPNILTLFLGWSVIEGIGAILVIPAVASLIAVNYKGRERVSAYAMIGGVSGAAAAAGPLIGGFVTTYLSWRYVFISETIIMMLVLLLSRKFKAGTPTDTNRIDLSSVLYSSIGMTILVFGMLQSKTWGWIRPITKPVVMGHQIAPLGISLTSYLILLGIILLKIFYDRQNYLEQNKKNPFIKVSMLKISQLKAGLSVLTSQYFIIASIFFIVPIYLQMLLGYDALKTGIKVFPLSIALIIFSLVGTKLVNKYSPRFITRIGQILLIFGGGFLISAINPDLAGPQFGAAMFLFGAGLGLLASQIGNVNMSSVAETDSSEVGGIQGSIQNLGSSLGTAIMGSILLISLTSGFIANINSSNLPSNVKSYISSRANSGVEIVPVSDVNNYVIKQGGSASSAQTITESYKEAQVKGLKEAIFALIFIATISILVSKNIPSKLIK